MFWNCNKRSIGLVVIRTNSTLFSLFAEQRNLICWQGHLESHLVKRTWWWRNTVKFPQIFGWGRTLMWRFYCRAIVLWNPLFKSLGNAGRLGCDYYEFPLNPWSNCSHLIYIWLIWLNKWIFVGHGFCFLPLVVTIKDHQTRRAV